ncbi:hypothetical protein ANOM_009861 [Aspergillus nomiae NRRL 13137]|uniref:Uncharacterized protein n=1 Tax=Aspergillus nomiae NRRL (strain ATCC 15546 / NRRL 13137 / CBS 260.88 / M93) TaxID=1509407 RepID=A0A0L1IRB4_ASPN3|nr:uncharacterized protein ANOM_009861 [Aspergillus nomiae NRRL 13137]KNG82126.1 hypothetical protein ANOM_009861 [Aspergillus nomiae NRRL 13137]
MASIEIEESTLANQTTQYVYLCRDPAPALAIPPGKDLLNYTAKLEHIYIYDPDTDSEICYTFGGSLSLGPGSIAGVVGSGEQIFLQYCVGDDQSRYMLPLLRTSGGHKLHRDVTSEVLGDDTILDRMLEEPENNVSNHFATTMFAKGDKPSKAKGAAAIKLDPKGLSGDLEHEVKKALKMLDFVDSMIGVYTANRLKQEGDRRGKPISAIDETSLHMKVTADAYFDAINHKQLAAVINKKSMASAKFSQTCDRAAVHPEFIKQFAQDIQQFDQAEYAKLDKILTEQVRQILDGNIDINDSVNFTLLVKQPHIQSVPGMTEKIVVPTLRLFYITSHGKTWTEVVKNGKSQSQVRKVQLDFQYIPHVGTINKDLFKQLKKVYGKKLVEQEADDMFIPQWTV